MKGEVSHIGSTFDAIVIDAGITCLIFIDNSAVVGTWLKERAGVHHTLLNQLGGY